MTTKKAAKRKKAVAVRGELRKITLAKPDFPDRIYVRRVVDEGDGSHWFSSHGYKAEALGDEPSGTRIATYQLVEIETAARYTTFEAAKR